MNNLQKTDSELRFVLRHYQKHKFDTRRAIRRMSTRSSSNLRYLRRIAAAVAMVVVFVGAYALYHHLTTISPQPSTVTQQPTPDAQKPSTAFHFENTPINEALREIGRRYGVELTASDTTRCITGDFETDDLPTLIDMIEQTLDIDIQP